jgi:putative hydrolases of HD superfamily
LTLILVHDLVEIYAGDTYAYDDVGAVGQAEREIAAAERLFAGLPPDLGTRMHAWWREFEAAKTPEARFAKAIDRMQGFAQNYNSGGLAWRENGIARERTFQRTALPSGVDPALRAVIDELYSRADREGLWPTE